jgi:hypothetical protein
MEPDRAPRLQAGVTESAPSVVAARLHAGVTVMDPGVPENMQEGVTVSAPTVAALNRQSVAHPASWPTLKVVAVVVPHAKPENVPIKEPTKEQPDIVREVPMPATKVSGAPTVRAPTDEVTKCVTVLIAVTATGAAWVVN